MYESMYEWMPFYRDDNCEDKTVRKRKSVNSKEKEEEVKF
jgi:hypothetical protein